VQLSPTNVMKGSRTLHV